MENMMNHKQQHVKDDSFTCKDCNGKLWEQVEQREGHNMEVITYCEDCKATYS